MVKDNLIKEKKFDEIQNLTTQAVHKMLGFKLAHIGINCDNEEQAHKVAEAFDFMFGFAPKENPSSIFSDTCNCGKFSRTCQSLSGTKEYCI